MPENPDPPKTLKELLRAYPRGMALIRYRVPGALCHRAVPADPDRDNEQTLRAHLAFLRPDAEFIAFAIH
ncbi:MAG: hypothetical protein NTW86_02450 [Candidatus Sumerlaeota bacterium]|nr:hypothetical protein [Candidatus Sumerlaeota bacterium]